MAARPSARSSQRDDRVIAHTPLPRCARRGRSLCRGGDSAGEEGSAGGGPRSCWGHGDARRGTAAAYAWPSARDFGFALAQAFSFVSLRDLSRLSVCAQGWTRTAPPLRGSCSPPSNGPTEARAAPRRSAQPALQLLPPFLRSLQSAHFLSPLAPPSPLPSSSRGRPGARRAAPRRHGSVPLGGRGPPGARCAASPAVSAWLPPLLLSSLLSTLLAAQQSRDGGFARRSCSGPHILPALSARLPPQRPRRATLREAAMRAPSPRFSLRRSARGAPQRQISFSPAPRSSSARCVPPPAGPRILSTRRVRSRPRSALQTCGASGGRRRK